MHGINTDIYYATAFRNFFGYACWGLEAETEWAELKEDRKWKEESTRLTTELSFCFLCTQLNMQHNILRLLLCRRFSPLYISIFHAFPHTKTIVTISFRSEHAAAGGVFFLLLLLRSSDIAVGLHNDSVGLARSSKTYSVDRAIPIEIIWTTDETFIHWPYFSILNVIQSKPTKTLFSSSLFFSRRIIYSLLHSKRTPFL